jgi:hypothetical protein
LIFLARVAVHSFREGAQNSAPGLQDAALSVGCWLLNVSRFFENFPDLFFFPPVFNPLRRFSRHRMVRGQPLTIGEKYE